MSAPAAITTPETLTDLIREALEKLRNGIQTALDKAAHFLNNLEHASWLGGILGNLGAGWVIDRFNDGVKKIWQGFTVVCQKVWDFVGDVLGRPLELQHLAEVYTRTQTTLIGIEHTVTDDVANLDAEWDGTAFGAYSTVAASQGAAATEAASLLSEVGALVSGSAKAILDLWTDMVANIAHTVIAAIGELVEATDPTKLITFETGPVLKALLAVADGLVTAAADFVKFVTGDATTTTTAWVDANVGGSALPNVQWPLTSAALLARVEDPGQWAESH